MITEFHKIPIQNKCESVQSCLFYGSNAEFIKHIESSIILHVNSMLAKWNSPNNICTQEYNYQNNNGNSVKIYDEETFIHNYQEILSPGLFNYYSTPKYIIIKEITSDKHIQIYKKILENEITTGIIDGITDEEPQSKKKENGKEIYKIFCFSTKLRSTSKIVQLFNKEKFLNSVKCYDITYQQKEKMIMNEINAMVQFNTEKYKIAFSNSNNSLSPNAIQSSNVLSMSSTPLSSSSSSPNIISAIKTFLMQLPIDIIMDEISKLNILCDEIYLLKKYLSNYKLQKDDTNIGLNFPYEFSNGSIDTITHIKQAEPISIVRILLNHFLKLLEAKELLQNGKNISQIHQMLGIFFKNQDIFKKQMASYTNIHIVKIMKMLNDVEIECKMNNASMCKEYMFMKILQYIQSTVRM